MDIKSLFRRNKPAQRSWATALINGYGSNTSYVEETSLKVAAVYRCGAVIAETLAQMPIVPYIVDKDGFKQPYTKHAAYYLLTKQPNRLMTRSEFWQRVVYSALYQGNGYAFIERESDGITPKALHWYPNSAVTVSPIDNGFDVEYVVEGIPYPVESGDMLHIKGKPSSDGYTGVSVLTYAREAIELADNTNRHASGFFKGGANLAGILTVDGPLTVDQAEDIKQVWRESHDARTGAPNGVALLPGNMHYQSIAISPADAQMLESRKLNVIDICRYFGVSPTKCYDLTKASYATVEAENDAFLSETLSPWIDKISLELERKLFAPSERARVDIDFDTTALLRTDRKSLAEFYNILFQMGCATPNEIRRRMNMAPVANGDATFTQVNVQPLDKHFEIETKPE